jgi:tetratricopeptide (TPR) repeat protein
MELTVEQILQQGVTAHKEGKLQEAVRLYSTIIQTQPTHQDANYNLGLIAVSSNNIKPAVLLFKTALEANPKIKQFWLSYIEILVKDNQVTTAKAVLRQGRKAGLVGEKVDALEVRLKQIVPSKSREKKKTKNSKHAKNRNLSQLQLNNLIEQYQNGKYEEAEKLAVLITQQFPEHQVGWKVLGAIFGQTDRKSEAIDAKKRAVKLVPQDAEAHYNLGITLQELDRLEEAEASYRQATALKPGYFKAHNNLGNVLKILDRLEEAEVSLRQAIKFKPDFAEPHNNLGITLGGLGRLEEAKESYRQAIALKPVYAEAHRHLAGMKTFDKRDEQFLQMQALSLEESCSEEQHCHLSFALAKAFEDLGDSEQAFKYYSKGNRLRKKYLKYDISQDIELFEKLKANYSKIEKNSLEGEGFSNKLKPIFIVGMPRSGTTLVEQIISSHSQVSGGGELPFVSQYGASIALGLSKVDTNTLHNFRKNYLKKLEVLSNNSPVITDKMPQNFRYIGLLAAAFPEAKIVHTKRNPIATCWANYKQYFTSNTLGYCYGLNDVVEYYTLYQNLMKFWETQLASRIYNFDYELLTTNQESETKKLINYLGLGWEESCLSPQDNKRSVATASNTQVRKKVYQGSSQKWKKFKPFLNGAFDSLDSSLKI